MVAEKFGGSPYQFAQYLIHMIKTKWKHEARSQWIRCPTSSSSSSSSSSVFGFSNMNGLRQNVLFSKKQKKMNHFCPEVWARGTNELNCDTVWPGVSYNVDLGYLPGYYDKSSNVIEKALAMSGVRMAKILNNIF